MASPTIAGTEVNKPVHGTGTTTPFSTVTFADADGDNLTVTVSIDESANGTFTAASIAASGFTFDPLGFWSFSGSPGSATLGVRSLEFDPNEPAAGTQVTNFTLSADDGNGGFVVNQDPSVIWSPGETNHTPVFAGAPLPLTWKAESANSAGSLDLATLFSDPDAGDQLTFSAMLGDGSPLPTWLSLTSGDQLVLTGGQPPPGLYGDFQVLLQAQDTSGAGASGLLSIFIERPPEFTYIASKFPQGSHRAIKIALDKGDDNPYRVDDLSFSITGGVDRGDFKMNHLTGQLKFKHVPDIEHPRDSNHDNRYRVSMKVSDGLFADEAVVRIKVTHAKIADLTAADVAPALPANHDWLIDVAI